MKFLILALTAALVSVTLGFSESDYKKTFKGEGTYYGSGNDFTGNCAIKSPLPPKTFDGRLSVAINSPQYEGACGACIQITGNGEGSGANPIIGPINAYISDRCPECKFGDVDLGMNGDGRWKIEWKLVPCTPSPKTQILWEGSNEYYWKFQPRGFKSPVEKVYIGPQKKKLERTQDNHWVWRPGKKAKKEMVKIVTVLGETVEAIMEMKPSGTNYASVTSSDNGKTPEPAEPPKEENKPKEEEEEELLDLDTRKGAPSTDTRKAITKVNIYVNNVSVQSVSDGGSVEVATGGGDISFEAIAPRKVDQVVFKIGNEQVTEKFAPYVFPGNRGNNYLPWKKPIYNSQFTLNVSAGGTTTSVKITLRK